MKDHPVIKVALLFVAGIASAEIIPINIYFVAISFLFSMILFFILKRFYSKYTFVMNLFISVQIFLIGNLLFNENRIQIDAEISEFDKVPNTTVSGKINKIDLIRKEELVFYLESDSMSSAEFNIRKKVSLLCKLSLPELTLKKFYYEFKPGNLITATGFYYKGREQRNPSEFDYNTYLNSKGIAGILKITDANSIKIISDEIDYLNNALHQVRKLIDDQLKKYHSSDTFSLLRGLLLADRGEINYETKTHFINAGVVHVLAVSGLNVGFIVLIFLLTLGRLNLFFRSWITIAGLIFYMVLTGSPASVFRATIMAVVIIIAHLNNRSNHLLNSIAIAALIILLIDPNQFYDTGFQLSFSAMISMAIFYPPLRILVVKYSGNNKVLKYFLLSTGLTLSAQIGTLPFTFYYFGKFSTISPAANLIVIPAIGIITGLGIFTLFISLILPFIAIYFAAANDFITNIIFWIINFSGSQKFSFIPINNYSLIDFSIFYLFLILLILFYKMMTNRILKLILILLVAGNIFLYSSFDDIELLPDNKLSIVMIDIGQGDSFLIKFPNCKTALVDAGNTTSTFDSGERIILPLLNYFGIEQVDYGIISHMDADHYGGFISLILEGKIKEVYKPIVDSSLSKDLKFEKFLNDKMIPVNYYKQEKMKIGNAVIYFMNDKSILEAAGKSTNDKSQIFKLIFGGTSFLFTGDMSRSMENLYVNRYGKLLDSDVLKIAHHGSKTSSSDIFLKYITPEFSLISAGFKNKFGHPSKEILDRIQNYSSEIYRTDLQGAVILVSDGESVELTDWKESI